MAGRRRSLLDRAKAVAGTTKAEATGSEPPSEADAAPDAPRDEMPTPYEELTPPPPPRIEQPVHERRVETPAPAPAAAPHAEPYAEVADEPVYADKSTGPTADTQPMGWGSSVHDSGSFDPIDDFFDTSAKKKALATPTPGGASPVPDPPRPIARDPGPAWADPMGVPGPPPLPGLSDRFTPPPAERRTPSSSGSSNDGRPSYLPTPPPAPPPDPRAGRRKPDDDDDDDVGEAAPASGAPRVVVIGLGVIGVGLLIGLMVLAFGWMGNSSPTQAVAPQPAPVRVVTEPAPGSVPVRTGLHDPNGAEIDTASPIPMVAPAPGVAPVPGAAPAPGTAPAPVAAPAPRPRPAPVVAPPLVVTKTGTLRVRSNRKVLVFVNGRAMGHAPLDLPLVPGGYTLTAALPSRPDTEQTKIIDLSAGETERVDFNF